MILKTLLVVSLCLSILFGTYAPLFRPANADEIKAHFASSNEITTWKVNDIKHVAAVSEDGHLYVSVSDPNFVWRLFPVNDDIPLSTSGGLASWVVGNVEHLSATGTDGHQYVFWWSPDQPVWRSTIASGNIDISRTSGVTSWVVGNVEHLAAVGQDGNLYDFWWSPGEPWRWVAVNGDTKLSGSGGVVYWAEEEFKPSGGLGLLSVVAEHLAAVGQDGLIYEFWWSPEHPWAQRPLAQPHVSGRIFSASGYDLGCHLHGPRERNMVNPAWTPVEPYADWPVIAEGIVKENKVSYDDFPWNHNTHDHNFDVILDPRYDYLNSDANGAKMEMEWEYADFPKEFWPQEDDRVWMLGRWVFDCGHPPYRTEIHPPSAVAFTRNETSIFEGDDHPSDTMKLYFFFHNKGGYFDAQFAPVLRNYELDIHVPPKTSPDAILKYEVENLNYGGPSPIITKYENENRVHVTFPLAPTPSEFVFNWDAVPGQDSEKLRSYLSQKFFDNGLMHPKIDDKLPMSHPGEIGDYLSGEIKKTDNGNAIRIGPNCSPPPSTYPICSSTILRLDSSKNFVTITFQLDRPNSVHTENGNYGNYFWHYALTTQQQGNSLLVYDYDHRPGFMYGAVIKAGWSEPILTHGYKEVRFTVNAVDINDNHRHNHRNCAGEGSFSNNCLDEGFNAKWRLWFGVNGHWFDIPGMEEMSPTSDGGINIQTGDRIEINKSINVIVPVYPDNGSPGIHIQTTGWVSGLMDKSTYVRKGWDPLPDDLGALGDYHDHLLCTLGWGNICSTLPIGIIDKKVDLPDTETVVSGKPLISEDYGNVYKGESIPTAQTDKDYTLSYSLQEVKSWSPGKASNLTVAKDSIALTAPTLTDISGQAINQVKAGEEVVITSDIRNNDSHTSPAVVIVEVRDAGGITVNLQWQTTNLGPNDTVKTGLAWTPEIPGYYQIRTFVISDITNPNILSEISTSTVTVG